MSLEALWFCPVPPLFHSAFWAVQHQALLSPCSACQTASPPSPLLPGGRRLTGSTAMCISCLRHLTGSVAVCISSQPPPSGPGLSNRKCRVSASCLHHHVPDPPALDQVTSITEQESICLQTSMTMCKLLLLLFLSDPFCIMESNSFLEVLYSRCQNLLKKIHNCPTWSQMLGDKRRRQFPELQVVSNKLEGRLLCRTELENNGDWQTSSIKGQEVKYFSHCGKCVSFFFFFCNSSTLS